MRIGTWNVNSFVNKTSEVTSEMARFNLDIVVLSETKKKGRGSEHLDNFLHFWSGIDKAKRAQAGVSVLIAKKLSKFYKNYNAVNERIVTVTLSIFGLETVIIGTYAPTDDSNQAEKDSYYAALSKVLTEIKLSQEVLIMGDLNARIGKKEDSKVVGKHDEDVLNDSGERLIDFCELNGLCILNGFFPHKLIHRYTRERPSLQQKSIIDYMIAKQISKLKFKDCRVKRGANCGSDHRLVVAELVVPFQSRAKSIEYTTSQELEIEESERIKYKLHLLHDASIKWLYQRRLVVALEEVKAGNDVELEYTNLKTLIKKVAFEVLGEQNMQMNQLG
ncbi:craniofacial development protein 2-like [Sitophilus oryzae]|uniref:Craniofacial development protein 2-like n=1 Tax=Sitophilus oryzae TaxID=7048 RepID=A0A6J2YPU3_SITOR|nr:craniofacial development protein 2-like [Sitophilus oryzae]